MVACGGGETLEPRSLPAALTSTLTITDETTAPVSPPTAAPDPTQLSSDEARANLDAGLTTGDCFTQTETTDEAIRNVVPCDQPHHGEVIATGPAACPFPTPGSVFEGLVSGYVGVAVSELSRWMAQEGVAAISQPEFDEDGLLVGTLCALVAQDGALIHSYRVAPPGNRSKPPIIE